MFKRAAHSLVRSEKISNFSFFVSLWIAKEQRNCNARLLAGAIPAELKPIASGSLWICNISTFQHRPFPFLLKLFHRLLIRCTFSQ